MGGPSWGYIRDAASDGTTLVLVGDDDVNGRTASIWQSSEGDTWTQITGPALAASVTEPFLSADSVYRTASHWVVLGTAWGTGEELSRRWIGWPSGAPRFIDVTDDNEFVRDVEWLAGTGITRECNPPTNDRYCPSTAVTREQMAALLHRAIEP